MTEEKETYEVVKAGEKSLGLIGPQNHSIFLSMERFEFAKKVGAMLAGSNMVPEHFRGQNGVGNCMIALNLSERLGVDVFGLMQVSYTVHGRPGFEAKLVIGLFNERTKLFIPPLRWQMEGDFPKGANAKCRAYAKDKETGEFEYGEWIDWEMVKTMGWYKRKGPDGSPDSNFWHTMPGQMFRYRSASFFVNAYEPGLKMGIQTIDELQDMVIDVTPKKTIAVEGEPETKVDYTATDLKNSEELVESDEDGNVSKVEETKTKDTPEDSVKLAFRKEWFALRTASYLNFVQDPKNTAKIEGACKQWPDIAKEMMEKWTKFCPKNPWPLLPGEEEPPDIQGEEEQKTTETDADPELEKFVSQVTDYLNSGVPEADLNTILTYVRVNKKEDVPPEKRGYVIDQLELRLQKNNK